MKRVVPFLIAGAIAEGALFSLECLQSHTGRGDGFGPQFFFFILTGILQAPAYGLVLLLQVPEAWRHWFIPPVQTLVFAIVFWLFFRCLIEPYRAKTPHSKDTPQ